MKLLCKMAKLSDIDNSDLNEKNTNIQQEHMLVKFILTFLVLLQCNYNLPYRVINFLLKFIKVIMRTLMYP